MTETTAIYSLSGLFSCGLGVLLYIAAGILLMMAGRWLSKWKPNLPGLLLFACYAVGVVCVLFAILDLTSLLSAIGSLLL